MPDTLATITTFINSPPGAVAAGSALAGIVYFFFKEVGEALNDQTTFEIARWLRIKSFESGLVVDPVVPWPHTFAKIFDRVFGTKHLSWKCLGRSLIATYIAGTICAYFYAIPHRERLGGSIVFALVVPLALGVLTASVTFLFDFLSLLETRYVLRLMERHNSTVSLIALLVLDVFLTGVTGLAPSYLIIASVDPQLSFSEAYFQDALPRSVSDAQRLFEISKGEVKRLQERYGQQSDHVSDDNRRLLTAQIKLSGAKRNLLKRQQLDHASEIKAIYWYPAFFTSIWLWLYAVSGFLLKAARRFDLGFQWFNSKLDVEKKPLQAIGLVSGAIVAVVYWSFALVAHFL